MEPIFDHEKLDVYGLQLQFVAWTADFLIEASQSPVPHRRELLDQLDRACLSILLNTAEGNGKRQGLQRAKFFGDARGSALECAACLDASVAKRIAKSDRIHSGKQLLIRIVAMLTRLVERFDSDEFRVRQDEPQCITNPAKYDVHAPKPKGREDSAQGFVLDRVPRRANS